MFDLTGKTALVTGATGGIGGEIAKAMHAAGAHVVLSGTREAALQDLDHVSGSAVVVQKTASGAAVLVGYLVPREGFDRAAARHKHLGTAVRQAISMLPHQVRAQVQLPPVKGKAKRGQPTAIKGAAPKQFAGLSRVSN